MGRKRTATEPRVVVAARVSAMTVVRLREMAARKGKRLSDILRDTIERAARRAA